MNSWEVGGFIMSLFNLGFIFFLYFSGNLEGGYCFREDGRYGRFECVRFDCSFV